MQSVLQFEILNISLAELAKQKFQPVKIIEKHFLNDPLKVLNPQCDTTHKKGKNVVHIPVSPL